jgi:BirA family biotin operon repressor/biotin-[acetyl-CoA-carboxylase] ligase
MKNRTEKPEMPEGYHLRAFSSLDSTNKEAIRAAEDGHAGNLWITAANQSAGKGRRGREWLSQEGNLFCSLLLKNNIEAIMASQLSFVAALAVYDTVVEVLGDDIEIKCKWPNDILVEGKKISGILLESSGAAGGKPDYIIIGIGLNLMSHPTNALYPAANIREFGEDISSEEALEILANYMADYINIWQRTGFADIRKIWLTRAKGQGSNIIVKLLHKEMTGRFIDLDSTGGLLLQTEEHLEIITAGDIFFPNLEEEIKR